MFVRQRDGVLGRETIRAIATNTASICVQEITQGLDWLDQRGWDFRRQPRCETERRDCQEGSLISPFFVPQVKDHSPLGHLSVD